MLRKLLEELASDLKDDVIKAIIKSDSLVNQRLRHYVRTNSLDTGAIAGLLASPPLKGYFTLFTCDETIIDQDSILHLS